MPDAIEERRRRACGDRRRVSKELTEIVQQLLRGQVVVERRILRKIADAPARGEIADRPSENLGAPGGRVDQLHEQLERGGLAGAVGTEEPEYFAASMSSVRRSSARYGRGRQKPIA